MKYVRLRALCMAVFTMFVIVLPTVTARAENLPSLIFSEIKIRNDAAGFDEYIELYNPTSKAILLNSYKIGYINAAAPTDTQQFTEAVIGDGLLASKTSLLLVKNTQDVNLPNSYQSPFSSLSDSGGTVRITDTDGTILDSFHWTSTSSVAIAPIYYLCTSSSTACNGNKSQSFQRAVDQSGDYILTDPTWQLGSPSPVGVNLQAVPSPDPEPDPVLDPEPSSETTTSDPTEAEEPQPEAQLPDPSPQLPDTVPNPIVQLVPVQITELLPNPAAPASDSTDEFIELYNPNDTAVDIGGYKLQSGNDFRYSYTLPAKSVPAHGYYTLYSAETGNVLSNTSGQARLLNTNGEVMSQTNQYESADEGAAWAFINGAWQWTTSPTPNAENVLSLPILKLATAKAASVKKTTSSVKAKTTTAKPATKTTAKVASAKTTKPATEREIYQDPEAIEIQPLHPAVLAGVGVVTVLYAVYEYRADAINYFRKLQRYRSLRRATRPRA